MLKSRNKSSMTAFAWSIQITVHAQWLGLICQSVMCLQTLTKTKLQCMLCKLLKGWMFEVSLLLVGMCWGPIQNRSRLMIRSAWNKALSGVDKMGLRRLWGRRSHQPLATGHQNRTVAAKRGQGHCSANEPSVHLFIQYMVSKCFHSVRYCASGCGQQMAITA